MKKLSLVLIKLYQKLISPDKSWISALGWGPTCRFTPTCSEYTFEAINKYGVRKGWIMGLSRIGRCHPFHTGGYDPVK